MVAIVFFVFVRSSDEEGRRKGVSGNRSMVAISGSRMRLLAIVGRCHAVVVDGGGERRSGDLLRSLSLGRGGAHQ
jgi:hypothetical protein